LYADGGRHVTGKFLVTHADGERDTFLLSVIYKSQATHHKLERQHTGSFSVNGSATKCLTIADVSAVWSYSLLRVRIFLLKTLAQKEVLLVFVMCCALNLKCFFNMLFCASAASGFPERGAPVLAGPSSSTSRQRDSGRKYWCS
jgi:hypothetical protein